MRSVAGVKHGIRWMIAGAMLMTLAFAEVDPEKTESVGGLLGEVEDALCLEGQALTGIHGFAGEWWDRLVGDCVLKNSDGSDASARSTTTTIGGSGGLVLISDSCLAGQVVSGIEVGSNSVGFVSFLRVWCKQLGTNGRTTGTAIRHDVMRAYYNDANHAGFLPNVDPHGRGIELHCPNNRPAVGLFGKEGLYVDRLGLFCGNINVDAGKLTSLTLNRDAVVGGGTATGTVTLDRKAASGGTSIELSLTGPGLIGFNQKQPVSLGVSVTPDPVVVSGTTATFQVNTTPRVTALTVTVTGAAGGAIAQDTLRIDPPAASSILFNPASVAGGTAINGVVTLNGAAPANFGVTVTRGSSTAITTSSPISALCSGTTCPFTVNTRAVSSDQTVGFASGTVNRAVTVLGPRIKNLTLSATTVAPGTPVTAIATLTSPVPAGTPQTGFTSVNLASSNTAAATVQSSAIAQGTNSQSPVNVGSPAVAACTQITASLNNTSASAFLGVAKNQSNDITLSFPNTSIEPGSTVTGTVTINDATLGAVNIARSNNGVTLSDTSVVVIAGKPATFTVRGGSSAGCTMVTVSAVTPTGSRQRSVMIVVTPSTFIGG